MRVGIVAISDRVSQFAEWRDKRNEALQTGVMVSGSLVGSPSPFVGPVPAVNVIHKLAGGPEGSPPGT